MSGSRFERFLTDAHAALITGTLANTALFIEQVDVASERGESIHEFLAAQAYAHAEALENRLKERYKDEPER